MSESESEVEAAHPRVQTRHLTRVYRRVTFRVYRRGAAHPTSTFSIDTVKQRKATQEREAVYIFIGHGKQTSKEELKCKLANWRMISLGSFGFYSVKEKHEETLLEVRAYKSTVLQLPAFWLPIQDFDRTCHIHRAMTARPILA